MNTFDCFTGWHYPVRPDDHAGSACGYSRIKAEILPAKIFKLSTAVPHAFLAVRRKTQRAFAQRNPDSLDYREVIKRGDPEFEQVSHNGS